MFKCLVLNFDFLLVHAHLVEVTSQLISIASPTLCQVCLFISCLSLPLFQLRLTVAEAVGSMCHLMPSDKLEEQIPRIIPAIMSLYKKNNEHYVISKVYTVHITSAAVCLLWICFLGNLCKYTEDHRCPSISRLLFVRGLLGIHFLSVI